MIGVIFRVSWLNLQRDRLALLLTFVLPIGFYSIFALVFGAVEREGIQRVDTVVVVEDRDEFSIRLAEALAHEPLVRLVENGRGAPAGRAQAAELVRTGAATVAIVLPEGLGEALRGGGARDDGSGGVTSDATVQLLVDKAHPVAADLAVGLVRSNALVLGYEMLRDDLELSAEPIGMEVVDLLGTDASPPTASTAYVAAGIGVLFLLFAVSGRSAILVEERERGVLRRMLGSRVQLWQLLAGRWLFLTALGAVQVTLMFVWGSIAFDLPLWTPRVLAGFAVMTAVTAASAAGFGLLLGSICRTRAQLNGVASVIILVMSALGGSMFPSFLMPEQLRRLGLLTFNAWALRGYQKVFWYDAGILQLWPQVAVLAGLCILFVAAAHLAARRWTWA